MIGECYGTGDCSLRRELAERWECRTLHAGVGGSDLRYEGKHRLQGRRRSDDLLEHRCFIDFFAQRNILVLESLLSLLAILDIGRRRIPTCEAALFIPNRVKAEKKPPILSVFS